MDNKYSQNQSNKNKNLPNKNKQKTLHNNDKISNNLKNIKIFIHITSSHVSQNLFSLHQPQYSSIRNTQHSMNFYFYLFINTSMVILFIVGWQKRNLSSSKMILVG